MTDTMMKRMQALEAVAEAADELDRLFISGCPYLSQARNKLHQAILAWRRIRTTQGEGCVSAAPTGCVSDSECAAAGRCLERDALPASPPGEAVEVAAHVRLSRDGGAYIVSGMGCLNGGWKEPATGATIATITARVPISAIPTVSGTVRLALVKEAGDAG